MNTETPFTPGPWRHDGNEVSADAGVIVRSSAAYDLLQEDLNLIAAAPDMYAALKPFAHKQFHEELSGNTQGDDSIVWERNGARLTIGDFRRAVAALAKAEGKS